MIANLLIPIPRKNGKNPARHGEQKSAVFS
jgi:hypothetical protein